MTQIFFGIGSGRVGSMALANALNCEAECNCLHEGKFRDMETVGEQLLPFLTLQNRIAYEKPSEASMLVHQYRNQMREIAVNRELKYFGDIAYNNAPFVTALHKYYPDAKFIFQFRDCLSFVRSCTAVDTVDETPVGWPPDDKPLSKVERYIALGRIQPRATSEESALWDRWSFVKKNIWLWAETNRIILEALSEIPKSLVYNMRSEDFRVDPLGSYCNLRKFLGIANPLPSGIRRCLADRPINKRAYYTLDTRLGQLTSEQRNAFERYSAPIRAKLGYT